MKALLIIFIFLFTLSQTPLNTQENGIQIMEEQKRRHSADSELSNQVMMLVDKYNKKEKRTIRWFSKKIKEGEYRYLIVFDTPAGIKGTTLLSWDHKGGESDQWIYLPAQKRLQRVAKGSKKGYFVGTDFTIEDLGPLYLDNFLFTLKGEELFDDFLCWIIEMKPATENIAQTSSYKKRILWIRKDIYFTVRIDFYDYKDKLIKSQRNYDIIKIEQELYRCNKSIMLNYFKDHKTLLAVTSLSINEKIDDKVFTEHYILSGRHFK